jgi:hypothetical protein
VTEKWCFKEKHVSEFDIAERGAPVFIYYLATNQLSHLCFLAGPGRRICQPTPSRIPTQDGATVVENRRHTAADWGMDGEAIVVPWKPTEATSLVARSSPENYCSMSRTGEELICNATACTDKNSAGAKKLAGNHPTEEETGWFLAHSEAGQRRAHRLNRNKR